MEKVESGRLIILLFLNHIRQPVFFATYSNTLDQAKDRLKRYIEFLYGMDGPMSLENVELVVIQIEQDQQGNFFSEFKPNTVLKDEWGEFEYSVVRYMKLFSG